MTGVVDGVGVTSGCTVGVGAGVGVNEGVETGVCVAIGVGTGVTTGVAVLLIGLDVGVGSVIGDGETSSSPGFVVGSSEHPEKNAGINKRSGINILKDVRKSHLHEKKENSAFTIQH